MLESMLTAGEIKREGDRQAVTLWDVTPDMYAAAFKMSAVTARTYFKILLDRGDPNVTRCGNPCKRYPQGKMLRMSRAYFEIELARQVKY